MARTRLLAVYGQSDLYLSAVKTQSGVNLIKLHVFFFTLVDNKLVSPLIPDAHTKRNSKKLKKKKIQCSSLKNLNRYCLFGICFLHERITTIKGPDCYLQVEAFH